MKYVFSPILLFILITTSRAEFREISDCGDNQSGLSQIKDLGGVTVIGEKDDYGECFFTISPNTNSNHRSLTFKNDGKMNVFLDYGKTGGAKEYGFYPVQNKVQIFFDEESNKIKVIHASGDEFYINSSDGSIDESMTTDITIKQHELKQGSNAGFSMFAPNNILINYGATLHKSPIEFPNKEILLEDRRGNYCSVKAKDIHLYKIRCSEEHPVCGCEGDLSKTCDVPSSQISGASIEDALMKSDFPKILSTLCPEVSLKKLPERKRVKPIVPVKVEKPEVIVAPVPPVDPPKKDVKTPAQLDLEARRRANIEAAKLLLKNTKAPKIVVPAESETVNVEEIIKPKKKPKQPLPEMPSLNVKKKPIIKQPVPAVVSIEIPAQEVEREIVQNNSEEKNELDPVSFDLDLEIPESPVQLVPKRAPSARSGATTLKPGKNPIQPVAVISPIKPGKEPRFESIPEVVSFKEDPIDTQIAKDLNLNCRLILKDFFDDPKNQDAINEYIQTQGKITLHRLAWTYLKSSEVDARPVEQVIKDLLIKRDPKLHKKFIDKRLGSKNQRLLEVMSELKEVSESYSSKESMPYSLKYGDVKMMELLVRSEKRYGPTPEVGMMNFLNIISNSYKSRLKNKRHNKLKVEKILTGLVSKMESFEKRVNRYLVQNNCTKQSDLISCPRKEEKNEPIDFSKVSQIQEDIVDQIYAKQFERDKELENNFKWGNYWLHVTN